MEESDSAYGDESISSDEYYDEMGGAQQSKDQRSKMKLGRGYSSPDEFRSDEDDPLYDS
jgi:hypothetical protein